MLMRILEIILSILILLAIGMNFALYPGGNFIMLCATSILSLLYFFLGFILFVDRRLRDIGKASTFKNIGALKLIFAIVTGVALSTLVLGILFRINFYPGAYLMVLLGLMVTLPVLMISIIAKILGVKDLTTTLSRTVVWGILGIALYLWPLQKHLAFQYRNHPGYVEAAIEAMNHPDNMELQEKMEEERRRIK